MKTKTYLGVSVWLDLPEEIVLGPEPGQSVLSDRVWAQYSPGYNAVPFVRAHGIRINLDGQPGRLWQGMDIPWESLPANIRHRLAHDLRAALKEASRDDG